MNTEDIDLYDLISTKLLELLYKEYDEYCKYDECYYLYEDHRFDMADEY